MALARGGDGTGPRRGWHWPAAGMALARGGGWHWPAARGFGRGRRSNAVRGRRAVATCCGVLQRAFRQHPPAQRRLHEPCSARACEKAESRECAMRHAATYISRPAATCMRCIPDPLGPKTMQDAVSPRLHARTTDASSILSVKSQPGWGHEHTCMHARTHACTHAHQEPAQSWPRKARMCAEQSSAMRSPSMITHDALPPSPGADVARALGSAI
jgi:hypothetical protein